MKSLLTVIVSMCNKRDNICPILQQITSEINCKYAIVVVCNSDKNTDPNVQKKLKLTFKHSKNLHDSDILREVKIDPKLTDSEYIIVTTSDLPVSSHVINNMVTKANETGADIVCTSRDIHPKHRQKVSLIKSLMLRFLGMILHRGAGLPVHDPINSFKLYRTSFLISENIESIGDECGFELVAKAFRQHRKIAEVPILSCNQIAGESNFKRPEYFHRYLRWFCYTFNSRFVINRFGIILCLAVLFFLAIQEFSAIYKYGVNVPYWDEWAIVVDLPRKFSWQWLFKFHNEHRTFFSRLIAWFLYHINGWNIKTNLIINFAVYMTMVSVVISLLWNFFKKTPLVILFMVTFFSTGFGWINMMNAFQGQFHWMLLFGFMAIYAGFKARETWKNILFFSLFCACSMFSQSPVFVLGILVVFIAKNVYLHLDKKKTMVAVILILSSFFLFMLDYKQPLGHPDLLFPNNLSWFVQFLEVTIHSLSGISFSEPGFIRVYDEVTGASHLTYEWWQFVLVFLTALLVLYPLLGKNGLLWKCKIYSNHNIWIVIAICFACLCSLAALITARGNSESWSGRHLELSTALAPCYAILLFEWTQYCKSRFSKYFIIIFMLVFFLGYYQSFNYNSVFKEIATVQVAGKRELHALVKRKSGYMRILKPFHAIRWNNATLSYLFSMNYSFCDLSKQPVNIEDTHE